jgi:hypothetical protein
MRKEGVLSGDPWNKKMKWFLIYFRVGTEEANNWTHQ